MLACRVVKGGEEEAEKGSWKVPDTRKQRRRLPQEGLSKWKQEQSLKYYIWIKQRRS